MPDAAWLMLAGMLSVAGMSCLALAMEVHWEQVMQRPADLAGGTRKALRVIGVIALLLALPVALAADRPSMAVLVWIMLLAGSAMLVAQALAWRAQANPRRSAARIWSRTPGSTSADSA